MSRKEIQEHVSDCHNNRLKPIMEKLDKLDEKFDNLSLDVAKLPAAIIKELDGKYAEKQKVEDLQDTVRWISRLIIGAVVLAILGILFKG